MQALAWAVSKSRLLPGLPHGGDESGVGDREGRPNKRFKIHGILRDALRQPSVGIIEEDHERGLIKYAKPAGVIASLVPMTNPVLTPPGTAINAIKARDAVIFSPHPRTTKTSNEVIQIMRDVLEREGAPADLLQCVPEPSIPLAQELMAICDRPSPPGSGHGEVRLWLGQPAFGVGAGTPLLSSTRPPTSRTPRGMTSISKTSDFGLGLFIRWERADRRPHLRRSPGSLAVRRRVRRPTPTKKAKLERVMWDENGARTIATTAHTLHDSRARRFEVPRETRFLIVEPEGIGKSTRFSSEKLTTLLAVYRYHGSTTPLTRSEGSPVGGADTPVGSTRRR